MVFNINVCVSLTSSVLSQLGVNEPSLLGSFIFLFLDQARVRVEPGLAARARFDRVWIELDGNRDGDDPETASPSMARERERVRRLKN
jgi:hypothetical protein